MAPHKPLGRGLSALLSSGGRGAGPVMRELPVGAIVPNRLQPRKRFAPEALAELAASIKEKGVATPVIVRRHANGYELIAGERRWRAARQAGLKTIPALVREASDREALELALVENVQREDLSPLEEAASYQLLLREMTQEELARQIGKDRATIANTLRLLKLPPEVQQGVTDGALTAGHARAILALETPAAQIGLFRRIVRSGLSVRQAEQAASRGPSTSSGRRSAALRPVEEELSRALGTKVRIRRTGKRGTIVVAFYSDEEFDRLVAAFHKVS